MQKELKTCSSLSCKQLADQYIKVKHYVPKIKQADTRPEKCTYFLYCEKHASTAARTFQNEGLLVEFLSDSNYALELEIIKLERKAK